MTTVYRARVNVLFYLANIAKYNNTAVGLNIAYVVS